MPKSIVTAFLIIILLYAFNRYSRVAECGPDLFENEMFYFYILISDKTNEYYVGSTENFEARLLLHNSGRVKSTKNERPWRPLLVQNFPTLKGARQKELQVKKWKSRKAIERLIKTSHFQLTNRGSSIL